MNFALFLRDGQKKMPWEAMLKKHKVQQAVHGKKTAKKVKNLKGWQMKIS